MSELLVIPIVLLGVALVLQGVALHRHLRSQTYFDRQVIDLMEQAIAMRAEPPDVITAEESREAREHVQKWFSA